MSIEEVVKRVLSRHPDITREDIVKAIEEKKAVSDGLLTDDAAARLVAAGMGVTIKCNKKPPRIYVRQLVAGLNNVTIAGRVLLVNKPRTFSRPEGSGVLAKLRVGDKTGAIEVVLWDDHAGTVKKLRLGSIIKLLHVYVRNSRLGELELHVGNRGEVQISPPDIQENSLPSIENFCQEIATIKSQDRHINVRGKIRALYAASEFERADGSEGKVMRIIVEDDSGKIPVAIWNEKVDEMTNAEEGMEILLMNCRAKKPPDGLPELHVGSSTNLRIFRKREPT